MPQRPAQPQNGTTAARFSDLEGFVLGLFWQFGPASPYDIRRIMLDSPSTQWSASTGAIYPLVRKLERTGHIKSRSERTGKRVRRSYAVTPKGTTALREWVGPPLAREAVSVSYDPLRTRARFLGVLKSPQRRDWIDAAIASLEEVQSLVSRWDDIYGGAQAATTEQRATLRMLTRHAELDLAARRKWLTELRDSVTEDAPKPAPRARKAAAQ